MNAHESSNSLHIRAARVSDAENLLSIYAPYVKNTAITFEYEVPSKAEFADRIASTLEKYPYIVAEAQGKLLGYAYAGQFHARPAYDWAVETSIYVSVDCRGQGIGRRLHDSLEKCLQAMGILNMEACIATTDIPDDNLDNTSMLFHAAMSYRMVGKFCQCGYKFGKWYDMVWMEKHIGSHLDNQPHVVPFENIVDQVLPFDC